MHSGLLCIAFYMSVCFDYSDQTKSHSYLRNSDFHCSQSCHVHRLIRPFQILSLFRITLIDRFLPDFLKKKKSFCRVCRISSISAEKSTRDRQLDLRFVLNLVLTPILLPVKAPFVHLIYGIVCKVVCYLFIYILICFFFSPD